MDPLVSIIIPTYNAENWIRETIESAIAQTWPKKEVIIIDDGSTDNTVSISRRFESKTVNVIRQENRGPCAARNKGLEYAQGEYIQWLDADDLLHVDKISRQLSGAENGLKSRVLLSSAMGHFYFRHQKAKFVPNSLWQDLTPIEWLLIKYSENVYLGIHAWLVSRKLTELAGPWDERLQQSDGDGEYICRVVTASERIKFFSSAKCYYRKGDAGALSMKRKKNASEGLLLRLYISHLLSIEDSKRTRFACLKLLQNWVNWLYPYNKEILKLANELAGEVGGTTLQPQVNWKFRIAAKLLGLRMARKAKDIISRGKVLFCRNWDRLLYFLFGSDLHAE